MAASGLAYELFFLCFSLIYLYLHVPAGFVVLLCLCTNMEDESSSPVQQPLCQILVISWHLFLDVIL